MQETLQQREACRVPTSLLEIVDLGNGEVVLQRADDDSAPLLRIQFSDESRMYVMDNCLEIAKAMIHAGIQATAELTDQAEVEIEEEEAPVSAPRTLH
jgi:hypothetical protein